MWENVKPFLADQHRLDLIRRLSAIRWLAEGMEWYEGFILGITHTHTHKHDHSRTVDAHFQVCKFLNVIADLMLSNSHFRQMGMLDDSFKLPSNHHNTVPSLTNHHTKKLRLTQLLLCQRITSSLDSYFPLPFLPLRVSGHINTRSAVRCTPLFPSRGQMQPLMKSEMSSQSESPWDRRWGIWRGGWTPEEYQRCGAHSRDSLVSLLRRIKLEHKRRPAQLHPQFYVLKFDLRQSWLETWKASFEELLRSSKADFELVELRFHQGGSEGFFAVRFVFSNNPGLCYMLCIVTYYIFRCMLYVIYFSIVMYYIWAVEVSLHSCFENIAKGFPGLPMP